MVVKTKRKRVVKRIPKLRRLAINLNACRESMHETRNMTLEEFWADERLWEYHGWAIRALYWTLSWGYTYQEVIWGTTKPDPSLIPESITDPLPDWIKRKWGGYERTKRATKKPVAKKVAKKKAA